MRGRADKESDKFVKKQGGSAPFMRCGKQKEPKEKRDRKKTGRKESHPRKKATRQRPGNRNPVLFQNRRRSLEKEREFYRSVYLRPGK